MAAERDTVDRLIAAHLATEIGAVFEASINGVKTAGLFVSLSETGASGFIPAVSLGGEYFRFKQAEHALVGDRGGRNLGLGNIVSVRLVEAAPVAGALRFEMLSEGAHSRHRRHAQPNESRRSKVRGAKAERALDIRHLGLGDFGPLLFAIYLLSDSLHRHI